MSDRTNTTQDSHMGAFTEGAAQVALFDTPGVVTTRHDLMAYPARHAQNRNTCLLKFRSKLELSLLCSFTA